MSNYKFFSSVVTKEHFITPWTLFYLSGLVIWLRNNIRRINKLAACMALALIPLTLISCGGGGGGGEG